MDARRTVEVEHVERELAELWREPAADGPVSRVRLFNFIVVCDDGAADLERATAASAQIARCEPVRILIVAIDSRASEQKLSAEICRTGEHGTHTGCEQVTLRAGADSLDLVPGTILPLLLGGMPVQTWWRRPRLGGEPLFLPFRDLSDRLIVESGRFADPAAGLAELAALAVEAEWDGELVDVTWAGSEPWREALASFFDMEERRQLLERATALEVHAGGAAAPDGLTAAGGCVAGWLASRLGWVGRGAHGTWRRPDGEEIRCQFRHVPDLRDGELGYVRLDTDVDGLRHSFVIERTDRDSPFVRLSIDAPGARSLARTLKLPERDEASLLTGILQRIDRDTIYEAALEGVKS